MHLPARCRQRHQAVQRDAAHFLLEKNMPLTANTAYTSLLANPVNFLSTYTLRAAGSGRASGITLMSLGEHTHTGGGMTLKRAAHGQYFKITPVAGFTGNSQFQTLMHVVGMDANLAAMTTYTLSHTGPALMMTGELTGCSFVITPVLNSNDIVVSHVRPGGLTTPNGQALRANLLASHQNSTVYGFEQNATERGMYGVDRAVTIIGIRDSHNRWRIFAQKRERNSQRFCSLYEIYPRHRKL